MDPLSAIGIASSVIEITYAVYELVERAAHDFLLNLADYGVARALLLQTTFLQAKGVIGRVRRHILDDPGGVSLLRSRDRDAEAWSLKKSYGATFNMIAVAGAIVAQIAITALTLPYLDRIHWTAEAAFVISLVAGLLAVYYACMVQLKLGSLQDPKEVKQWLTTHRTSLTRRTDTGEHKEAGQAARFSVDIPSYYSALLLVAPSELLNWSLASLLVGIGIYFGLIFTENLGLLRGEDSNLAVLVVYVIFTVGALGSYFVPTLLKLVETSNSAETALKTWVEKYSTVTQATGRERVSIPVTVTGDQGIDTNGEGAAESELSPETTNEILRALQQSISAQADSLRAQEALLKSYLRRG